MAIPGSGFLAMGVLLMGILAITVAYEVIPVLVVITGATVVMAVVMAVVTAEAMAAVIAATDAIDIVPWALMLDM